MWGKKKVNRRDVLAIKEVDNVEGNTVKRKGKERRRRGMGREQGRERD